MAKKMPNTIVKITGDLVIEKEDELFLRSDVIDKLRQIENSYSVMLLPGSGSKISRELEKRGAHYEFGPEGREIESASGRHAAKNILKDRRARIQNSLRQAGLKAMVISCFRYMGSVLCHVNGDLIIKEAYVNFPRLFIFTLNERLKKKKREFRKHPKIEVVGFPEKYKGKA